MAKTNISRKRTSGSSHWLLAVAMFSAFILGLLWIVAFYIAPTFGIFATWGSWNLVIGFGLITLGFVLSTRWR